MNKIRFFDKRLLKKFSKVFSGFTALVSFLLLFVDIPKEYKFFTLLVLIVLLVIYYIIDWNRAKKQKKITLKFGDSDVEVYFGDIFKAEKSDLKIISFNEYFDTEVDGQPTLVSSNTINGKFLMKYKDKIEEFNSIIDKDQNLNSDMLTGTNSNRKYGKKNIYRLGSLVNLGNNYFAVAGSKFNEQNKANMTMREYIGFLLTFWSEVDRIYNNTSVVIPVFGSGILRFTDGYAGASPQELLEIIIWTFKISRIKIAYPSKIKIVVFENKSDKYNLYKLKGIEKDGL